MGCSFSINGSGKYACRYSSCIRVGEYVVVIIVIVVLSVGVS